MVKTPAEILSKMITFRTVCGNRPEFEKMLEFMKCEFPLVFSKTQWEKVENTDALLFKLPGRNHNKPTMFIAHQDVVPADNASDWTHDPFEGHMDKEYVWGRGSFDIKNQIAFQLTALERLLEKGFVPENDLYLGYGDDEEVKNEGAIAICRTLQNRGVRLDFLLDEGGSIVQDFISGMKKPIAAVGAAEKGCMNILLTANSVGGHSSTPVNPTALGILGKAAHRIEKWQFKTKYISLIPEFLSSIAPSMSGFVSFALRHNRLFRPVITSIFLKNPSLAPFIRNTHAITMANGSSAMNIVPDTATMLVNIRYLPQEKPQEILKTIEKVVNDSRIKCTISFDKPASEKVASSKTPQFELLKSNIEKVFDSPIVAPYLMLGGSDALRYEPICDNILRLTPGVMTKSEVARMHGIDERLSIENCNKGTEFYTQMFLSV